MPPVGKPPIKDIEDHSMDIAIIGMSGVFPQAENIDKFWDNIKEGRYCIGEIPEQRFNNWQSLVSAERKDYPEFGYIEEIDSFDANFFQMAPGEIPLIDPSQKILLEKVNQALEFGGYGGKKMSNTQTGVFISCGDSGYKHLITNSNYSKTTEVGNIPAVSAGRISHYYNLRGPSLLIDTACSSSLAAIHYACRSLKNNECTTAIVATVNIYAYMKKRGIDPGKEDKVYCKIFDDSPGTMINGEGAGALILKPLARAQRDNDYICAVIKGTAINHNGSRTATIAGQKPEALTEVIDQALADARINPETLSYMEASGAGTIMGDPIEVKAITDAFSKYTSKKQFCALGSIKANIGHLNHTSGLAGIIKVIQAMRHKQIPPLANFEKPNSYIDFEDSPLYIETGLKDWELENYKLRRAGVSSFSINGTNCHLILEEAPPRKEPAEKKDGKNLLALSATSPVILHKICSTLKNFIIENEAIDINHICHTINSGRTHHSYRLAILARQREEFIKGLDALNPGDTLKSKEAAPFENVFLTPTVNTKITSETRAVFLFPGGKPTGSLLETCRDFYKEEFKAVKYMNKCEKLFDFEKHPQALIFAFQYALANLWVNLGIKPAFVLGFGIGKYVSKTISGKMELKEAMAACMDQFDGENFFSFNEDKFAGHISQLYKKGQGLFIEIGPENVLADITRNTLNSNSDFAMIPSYDSTKNEEILLRSIAQLYSNGINMNFSALFPGEKIPLPLYPFNKKRYWVKNSKIKHVKEEPVNMEDVDESSTPADNLRPRPQLSTEYTAPVTIFEKESARIVSHFLGLEQVGMHDSFFELGFNSLSLLHLNNLLKQKTGKEISIVTLFEHPTIHALGKFLSEQEPLTAPKPIVLESGQPKTGKLEVKPASQTPATNNLLQNSIQILRNNKKN